MTSSTGGRELADRLHSVAIHLLRHVRPADAASGLSAARLSALSVLVFGGPRSVTELAAAEQVTAATMSRLLSALASEGLVRREPDRSDARRVKVSATAAGRRALETGRARRVSRLTGLLEGLDGPGREAVGEAVSILEAALAAAPGD